MSLVPCRHCGNPMAKAATACPRCGGPAPRRTSRLTWAFAILFAAPCLAGVVISAVRSANGEVSPSHAQWLALRAEPPETTAARKALIQKMLDTGAIRKIERSSVGTTVAVGPAFYLAEFDTKQAAMRAILLDALREHEMANHVELVDVRSGKKVGSYSDVFGLKME